MRRHLKALGILLGMLAWGIGFLVIVAIATYLVFITQGWVLFFAVGFALTYILYNIALERVDRNIDEKY